jgi:hypothetical protein
MSESVPVSGSEDDGNHIGVFLLIENSYGYARTVSSFNTKNWIKSERFVGQQEKCQCNLNYPTSEGLTLFS